jgi:hypothetical protein
MWPLYLLLKQISAGPVTMQSDAFDESIGTSYLNSLMLMLMQAVLVSVLSLLLLYVITVIKSRTFTTRHGPLGVSGVNHKGDEAPEQRLFRLDHHPAMLRAMCGTPTPSPHSHSRESDSTNESMSFTQQVRRKIADLESIPVWQVPKMKSHRTNH